MCDTCKGNRDNGVEEGRELGRAKGREDAANVCKAAEKSTRGYITKRDGKEYVNMQEVFRGLKNEGWVEGHAIGFAKTFSEYLGEGKAGTAAIENYIETSVQYMIAKMRRSGMTEEQIKQVLYS